MVKTDPSAFALLNVLDEGDLRGGRPIVGRIIELDEKRVFQKECVIDFCGVFDVSTAKLLSLENFASQFLAASTKGRCMPVRSASATARNIGVLSSTANVCLGTQESAASKHA